MYLLQLPVMNEAFLKNLPAHLFFPTVFIFTSECHTYNTHSIGLALFCSLRFHFLFCLLLCAQYIYISPVSSICIFQSFESFFLLFFYCSLSSCAHDLNIPLHITMWSITFKDTAHFFGTIKMQQLINRFHYGIGTDSTCMEIFQLKNMNYAMLTHFVFKSYHTHDIPKAEENSKYKFGLVCAIVNFKCFFFVLFSNSMPYIGFVQHRMALYNYSSLENVFNCLLLF